MNKDNLKLYGRATWHVLIADPLVAVWNARKYIGVSLTGLVLLIVNTIALYKFAVYIQLMITGVGIDKIPYWTENAAGIALTVWLTLIELVTLVQFVNVGFKLVKAIKTKAEQLVEPKPKTRSHRSVK